MQVNQFIHYLDHSKELADVSETEIASILKEFPYCQTGQLMSAINLNLNNSILFEEQLKRAASICPDRTKLFEQLHQNTAEVVVQSQEADAILIDLTNVSETVNEQKEEVKPETNEEHKPASVDKFIPVEGEDELTLLEKEYLTSAISSTILLESDEAKEIKLDVKEVELFDDEVNHSFSSWLKHYNGEDIEEDKPSIDKLGSRQDVIDRFIQEDPRIKPKKTEFYSPTNMARLSVTDSGIVSETLALIHVDQGNFQGAIDAYEKLMLKNPKKRSYFAAQIKILKQKLK